MSIRKRKWSGPNGETLEAWLVDYVDSAGKRRAKSFRLKKEADAFAARARVEVNAGTHTPDSIAPTVATAAETWLAECEASGLERSTVAQYRQHVRLHIVPVIGATKLSRLTVPAVYAFRDALLKGDDERKPRSAALTRKVLTTLGSIVSHAKERGAFAGANPVRDMGRGRRIRSDGRHKKLLQVGVDIPSPEEIKRLLAAVPNDHAPILKVAVFSGLRASELRGLRWRDVDFKAGELHVRQRADRYREMGSPKSRAGGRNVPLPPGVIQSLREWKLRCPKTESGLVFPTKSGKVWNHKNVIREALDPAQISAKLVVDGKPKYSMHGLRHFFASWCINRRSDGGRELPLKVVQGLMGHSSIGVTGDVYGHLFPRGDDAEELAAAERRIIE